MDYRTIPSATQACLMTPERLGWIQPPLRLKLHFTLAICGA
jgi:hypothetical protein